MKAINGFLQLFTSFKMDSIEKYHEEMESSISKMVREFEERAKIETQGLSSEEQEAYYDFHLDEFHEIKNHFPSLLRYSIVLSLYTTIEHTLKKIHNIDQKNNPVTPSFKKYKSNNSDIEALSLYIKENIESNIPIESEEWNFILKVNKIRNNIVHSSGRIYDDKNPDSIKGVISEMEYVSISSSNEILLEEKFILVFIEKTILFFDKLFEKIKMY